VISALRDLGVLLTPKLLGLGRNLGGRRRSWLRPLLYTGLALAFACGIFLVTAWLLRQVLQVELVGQFIPRMLMSLVLLVLLSVLLLSTTISSFSVFFLSEDLGLLMAAPVPTGPLFFARFLEMLVYSSWMVLGFGLPVFLAFGQAYRAPAGYFLALGGLFPAMVLLPGALGALLAVVLTRLFSARRSRDLVVVLTVVGFVVLYLIIRLLQPERMLQPDAFGSMVEFMQMFGGGDSRLWPHQWMADFLFPLLQGRPVASWRPALLIWSTAAGLVAVTGWLGSALYRGAYDRAQRGRVRLEGAPDGVAAAHSRPRPRPRALGAWLDRLALQSRSLGLSLLVKDARVFLRDPNQWLQLLLLGALAAVYLLNFSYLRLAEFGWFTLYTVNHVMVGLVLAGVAVRFVFPAVSLEGRAWWIVRSAPLGLADFMHAKLLISFVPLAGLGLGLAMLSCVVIDVPAPFYAITAALTLAMSLVIACLGVGLGAIFPRFHAENPAKIPAGVGGVTFMIVSMLFVLVFLLAAVYPTFLLYQLPQRLVRPFGRTSWLASSVAALGLLTVLGAWLPMFLGRKLLARRED
jgi:ABC-2 type transport system permease protein